MPVELARSDEQEMYDDFRPPAAGGLRATPFRGDARHPDPAGTGKKERTFVIARYFPRDHDRGDAAGEQPRKRRAGLLAAGTRRRVRLARVDADGPDLPVLLVY